MSMMQGSKSAWIANAKRIAIEAEALERKTGTGSKSEEMKHEAAEFAKLRNEAKLATSKRVHGIRLVLSDIQNKIQTGTWQNNSALRNHLETFESKLTAFKLLMHSEYDTLEETSHVLESDIERLTSEFDSWDHPDNEYLQGAKDVVADAEAQKRITERNRVDLERRAYIGAIDRKIAALGREGGWDPRDHECFLRIWIQHFESNDHFEQQLAEEERGAESALDQASDNNRANSDENDGDSRTNRNENYPALDGDLNIPNSRRSAIVKKLATAIPWKNLDEFDEHINWYLTHLRLTLIKKKAVNDWKQEQLSAKRQLHEEALASDAPAGSLEDHYRSGVRDASELSAGEEVNSKPGGVVVSERERALAKQRIAKWKAEQAAKQEEEKLNKAQSTAAQMREAQEEIRRKQLSAKQQLDKWKASEALNQELVVEATAKLQRPKSVDPAALRQRQAKDLLAAKARADKVDQTKAKLTARERTIKEAAVATVEVDRDPQRLLAGTKASKLNALSYEALDQAERRRSGAGAHGAPVAMSGRDLQFAGRATPQWMKGNH